MVKSSLYAAALLLIALGALGYVEHDGGIHQKEMPLTDIESLRDLPGTDGCVPGTHRPSRDGFPGVCVDATPYY